MEDSMSFTNHISKTLISVPGSESSSKDSSWSLYIDNSLASNSNGDSSFFCSGPESSSEFSVAAVLLDEMYDIDDYVTSTAKRRKTITAFVDPDLEDTASSPVSSSKVRDLEKFSSKVQDANFGLSVSSPTGTEEYQKERNGSNQTRELVPPNFIWNDISCQGLREKGLCLVPVSMLFNVL